MPTCVPIKDMRDTASFSNLVESSPDPVIVTKNGYDQFVVIRSKDYDKLKGAYARAQLMERILIAERERAEGNAKDAFESLEDIRKRHGL